MRAAILLVAALLAAGLAGPSQASTASHDLQPRQGIDASRELVEVLGRSIRDVQPPAAAGQHQDLVGQLSVSQPPTLADPGNRSSVLPKPSGDLAQLVPSVALQTGPGQEFPPRLPTTSEQERPTVSPKIAIAPAATEVELGDALHDGLGDIDVRVSTAGTDPVAIAVASNPVAGFPTGSDQSFVVLSTGKASDAFTANSSGSLTTILGGRNNAAGLDEAVFTIQLRSQKILPRCIAVDFRFFSEEFPEFVGSSFNDSFFIERAASSNISVNGNVASSPANIAFDSTGEPISINTTFGAVGDTGTTYDGATPTLTTSAANNVEIGETDEGEVVEQSTLIFSILDLGDNAYDSTVLIDNLRLFDSDSCTEPTTAKLDSDGDALLDDWEINGYDADGDGTIDVDLPAMGANPNIKDVFIEVDWFDSEPNACLVFCIGGASAKPDQSALNQVIAAFAAAPEPIQLHIDAGSGSPMKADGTTWGAQSRSTSFPYFKDRFGTNLPGDFYSWSAFDGVKNDHFDQARRDIFHYVLYVRALPLDSDGKSAGGISRGFGSSDFLVAESDLKGERNEALTFMHELGHNLGLRHGGSDHNAYKPNYLSIMNYLYAFDGLDSSGKLDYSREVLTTLDVNSLSEFDGITNLDGSVKPGYAARWFCPGDQTDGPSGSAVSGGGLDWNCNKSIEAGRLAAAIDGKGQSVLIGHEDWSNLLFDGGLIGNLALPDTTPLSDEPPFPDVPVSYRMSVTAEPGNLILPNTGTSELAYDFTNTGTEIVKPAISIETELKENRYSVSSEVPEALAPGETMTVLIETDNSGISDETAETLTVRATIQGQANSAAAGTATLIAAEEVDCVAAPLVHQFQPTHLIGGTSAEFKISKLCAGSYDVVAVTGDQKHASGYQTSQTDETVVFELLSNGGNLVSRLAPTHDIPEKTNLVVTIRRGIEIDDNVDSLRAIGGSHSVEPVAIAFIPISTDCVADPKVIDLDGPPLLAGESQTIPTSVDLSTECDRSLALALSQDLGHDEGYQENQTSEQWALDITDPGTGESISTAPTADLDEASWASADLLSLAGLTGSSMDISLMHASTEGSHSIDPAWLVIIPR